MHENADALHKTGCDMGVSAVSHRDTRSCHAACGLSSAFPVAPIDNNAHFNQCVLSLKI